MRAFWSPRRPDRATTEIVWSRPSKRPALGEGGHGASFARKPRHRGVGAGFVRRVGPSPTYKDLRCTRQELRGERRNRTHVVQRRGGAEARKRGGPKARRRGSAEARRRGGAEARRREVTLSVTPMNSEISNLKSQISNLKSQISNLKSQVSSLKSQVLILNLILNSQFSILKSQISNLIFTGP
jgi:hypothetical protein